MIKATGLEPNEIQELLTMAQKAGPAKPVAAEPEPEDEPEDEFGAPDDDEMAAKADRMARRGK